MNYYYYFVSFPNGDKQQINHQLNFGDIVDINGNLLGFDELDPHRIAYKVTGCKREDYFKEITWLYRLELLTRDDVEDEINYQKIRKFKNEDYDKILKKIQNRIKKRKRS